MSHFMQFREMAYFAFNVLMAYFASQFACAKIKIILRRALQRHYVHTSHLETITVYCSTSSTIGKVLAYCWFGCVDFG